MILIVDDDKAIRQSLALVLKRKGYETALAGNPDEALGMLRKHKFRLVIMDMNYSLSTTGEEGIHLLRQTKIFQPDTPVILITAWGSIELAVEGMRFGAFDFITKPWNNHLLLQRIETALSLSSPATDSDRNPADFDRCGFIGENPRVKELLKTVERIAPTDAPVLVLGENGTGKEMLARELHRLSNRRDELIVPVDLGAIPETLFESELFGYVKGAFTDARSDRAGKFEAASKGTLFLDEIGNLPYHQQAKLLTALQSRSIVRVGSNTPIPVDIRLISATNRDLDRMVADGGFREDLLYRINTIHIELPSLAERTEDIVPLAEIFLKRYATKYNKPCTGFDPQAREKLTSHTWPGNIRELQHTVEKAVIMADTESVTADELLISRREGEEPGPRPATFSTLEEMERSMVTEALKRHEGNLSAVAAQLGVTRQTLYNKLKKYNL